MCAIVGSFNRDKFEELIELNTYRGNHSYSFAEYDIKNRKFNNLVRDFGYFDFSVLDGIEEGNYLIGHVQAPTTDSKDKDSIHPSELNETFLWHNGIIKEDCVRELQTNLGNYNKWDTNLLHQWIINDKDLSEIDGTFSCLYANNNSLFLFRNEISPMFIDKDFNLSSTKFVGSKATEPNELLIVDLNNKKLNTKFTFTTKENPYFWE